MRKPTRRQIEWVRALHRFSERVGRSPSVRELCVEMGCRGTNAGHEAMDRLAAHGYIARSAAHGSRSRGLRVTEAGMIAAGITRTDSEEVKSLKAQVELLTRELEAVTGRRFGGFVMNRPLWITESVPSADTVWALNITTEVDS